MAEPARRKILFILPNLAGGGAERVMITLVNNLDRGRFDPHLLVLYEDGPLKDLIDENVTYLSLNKKRALLSLFALYRAIRGIGPECIVSTMTYMNLITLCLKPFLPGIKFIVREAVTPSYFLSGGLKRRLQFYLGPACLYGLADYIVSPAQVIFDEFHDKGVKRPEKEIVIYNPVDMQAIEKTSASSVRFDGSRINFVCSGRLHPQKGFDMLIENLNAFNHPSPWHLYILGEGAQRQDLQNRIDKNGLSDNITLCGFVNGPWDYYKNADCFLLPSRHEGLPNVALESLACGTPVIALDSAGGIAEIAEQSQKNAVQISHSIEDFVAHMSRVSKKDQGSSLLGDVFTTATAVKQLQALF